MSETRIAAVVCEGQTDVPVLRSIIQTLWPSVDEVQSLQPMLDQMERAKGPSGWTEVQTWCEQNAPLLADVLEPDVGDPIDLLVVAVDVDIAVRTRIAAPAGPSGAGEGERLRKLIASWLKVNKRKRLAPAVVISTPVRAIEAWVIAALFPNEDAPEQIVDGARWLLDQQMLKRRRGAGKPWKDLHRYRDFAEQVANSLPHVRSVCPEAERTSLAIEARRKQVEGA